MGAPNLFFAPGAVQPCYAPVHQDCLAKLAKFVYKNTCPSSKLSPTNYLNKILFIQSHLTSEDNLKVEKRYITSKTSTTFYLPRQKRLGYA